MTNYYVVWNLQGEILKETVQCNLLYYLWCNLRYGPCQLMSRICDLDIHVFKCLYLLMCKVYESETQYAHWTYSGEHVVKIRRRGLNRNTGNVVNKFLH